MLAVTTLLFIGSCTGTCFGQASSPAADDVFGHEANPTGDPVGGGEGYRDIRTNGDFTVTTAEEFLSALKQAQSDSVIFIPDGVEIDLTETATMTIPASVTLAGTRGLDGSAGALLKCLRSGVMFTTGGDRVRLTGLRFEGPYGGNERVATSATFMTINHYGADVDNCEIYNFNVNGIVVNATGAHIHHNFLHHIWKAGLGYPVRVNTSDTRIIANRFDYGRHPIASGGFPGNGYEAAYNWCGPNMISHEFDMHGGRDRGDGTNIAGDWMHIHHNTFESTRTHIGIRGIPSHGAWIHNNWFAGPASEKVSSGGNTHVYHNVYGPDKALEE